MPELDMVRGVAITLVVLYHAFFWSNQDAKLGGLQRLFISGTQPGWLGVELFFVLSGFLISGLLLDAKPASARRFFVSFYGRRALRILPLYYLVLTIAGIALLSTHQVSIGFLSLSAVYLSNIAIWIGSRADYPLAVLWSLAVEEQFYLVWPALTRLLSFNLLFIAVIGLCVVEPVVRALSFVHWGFLDRGIYILTWYRLDSFAWGACLALFLRSSFSTRQRFRILSLLLIVVSLTMVVLGLPHGITTRTTILGAAFQLSCIAILFAGLMGTVLLIGSGTWAALVNVAWLRYLGKISYCLYLIHQLCFWLYDKIATHALSGTNVFLGICFRALVAVSAAVCISALSRRYFEARFLALKSRFAL